MITDKGIIYYMDYATYTLYFELQGYSRPTPTTGDVQINMGTRSN